MSYLQLPTQDQLATQLAFADQIQKSNLLPKWLDTKEKTLTTILSAMELSIPPLVGCREMYIVNGAVGFTSKLMLGRVLERYPNTPLEYQRSAEACTVLSARPGAKNLSPFTFTLENAKNAGLLAKDIWRKYPQDMLQWRAVAKMVKALFPEVMLGAHYVEELPGVEVDKDGNVVTSSSVIKVQADSDSLNRVNHLLSGGTVPPAVEESQPSPDISDQSNDSKTRAENCLARFAGLGLTRKQVEEQVGHTIDENCSPDDFDNLWKIFSDLKGHPDKVKAFAKPASFADRARVNA